MRPSFRVYLVLGIVWLASVAFFLSAGSAGQTPSIGFPLDDTWIHFSFARNLAEHNCFGLNPDEPSSGSTSPLWVALLAGSGLLNVPFDVAAVILGMIFVFLTALCVYKLVLSITGQARAGLYAGVFVLLSGRFLWGALSGMEVALFSFLAGSGIYVYQKAASETRVRVFPFVVFGLASLARPEGHLLFALAFLGLFFRPASALKREALRIFLCLFVYGVIVAPYMAFSWILTHRFFCSSYYSKMLFSWRLDAWSYLKYFGRMVFWDNPFLAFFIIPGLVSCLNRKNILIAAWLVGFPLIACFAAPILIHHGRYAMPLIPFYALAGFLGIWRLLSGRARQVFLVLVFGWALVHAGLWAKIYAQDSRSIYRQHYRAALWLKKHTPADEAIAASDIGVLSYVSGRRIVDLCGIIRLSIFRIMCSAQDEETRRHMLWRYLAARRVRYIAYYREWFPWMDDGRCLRKVYEVTDPENSIAAGNTMEIFRVLCTE